jgi:hypothetical protein
MRAFERRALTEGEAHIAAFMFGDTLLSRPIRILQAVPGPFAAMVPLGRTIIFAAWRAPLDFSESEAHERGWFVHELAHVWQARAGIVLAGAKLQAIGRHAYRYRLVAGRPFHAYNIEQQAEIARHLYLARTGEPDASAPDRADLEAVWPIHSGNLA